MRNFNRLQTDRMQAWAVAGGALAVFASFMGLSYSGDGIGAQIYGCTAAEQERADGNIPDTERFVWDGEIDVLRLTTHGDARDFTRTIQNSVKSARNDQQLPTLQLAGFRDEDWDPNPANWLPPRDRDDIDISDIELGELFCRRQDGDIQYSGDGYTLVSSLGEHTPANS
jgi:hypothetical protein